MSAQPIYADTENYELAVIVDIDGRPYGERAIIERRVEQIADMHTTVPSSVMPLRHRLARAARPSARITR